jgi:hypothetical protein
MAIQAEFVADFSKWKAEVLAAQTDLKGLQASAESATKEVAKLTDEGAGRFTVTAAEIRKAGGATKDLSDDFKNFDSVLSSVGVNIGSHVKAFGELKAAAGQSATSLGAVGTAGLAVGAAFAGWQLGRMIADVLGLDKAVADLATRLLDLGDVKAQTAAARTDAMAIASQRAGREITSMSEAVAVNNKWLADWLITTGRSKDVIADSERQIAKWRAEIAAVKDQGNITALTHDLDSQNFSLDELSKRYGIHIDALQFYQRELAKALALEQTRAAEWKTAVDAMQAATRATEQVQATMWKRSLELNKENNAELVRTSALYADVINKAIAAEVHAKAALAARQGLDLYGNRPAAPGSMEGATGAYETELGALKARGGSMAEQEELFLKFRDNFTKASDAAGALGDAHVDAGNKSKTAADHTQRAGDQTRGAGDAAQSAAGLFNQAGQMVVAGAQQAVQTFRDRAAGQAHGYETALNRMENMFSAYARAGVPVHGGLIPQLAAGGPVTAGRAYMVGERGPELFTPTTSGTISPNGATGGSVTVNVAGLLLTDDPAARSQLAAMIEAAIINGYRQHGHRLPV